MSKDLLRRIAEMKEQEIQREIGYFVSQLNQKEKSVQDLIDQLHQEERNANPIDYEKYRLFVLTKKKIYEKEITLLESQLEVLRENLKTIYVEKKRYEILQEEEKEQERKAREQKEQKELDEFSLRKRG